MDVVQLHGSESPGDIPHGTRVWKAFRVTPEWDSAVISTYAEVEAFLLDGPAPGTGVGFDWRRAHRACGTSSLREGSDRITWPRRSGRRSHGAWMRARELERAPGWKDHEKMRRFVRAALGIYMIVSQPDASGHFGPYGGRYVPEVLMAPLEELEQAYLEARSDRGVPSRTDDLLENYAGRPTPLYFARAAEREPRRRADLSQARRPAAHGRAQDQQRAGPGAARQAHGQAAHYRGNRGRPAWRRDRHGLRAVRARVRRLHGRGRHAAAAAECLPHAPAGREGGGCHERQPDAERCDQRSDARLGHQCRRHVLPARLRAGRASVSDDGARFPPRDRRGGAPADSRSWKAGCRMPSSPVSAAARTRSASFTPSSRTKT